MPSPGTIKTFHAPGGHGVRVDSHIYSGYAVPPHYDSLIGKLITHGDSRDIALKKMRQALDEFIVEGIRTNAALHRELVVDSSFVAGGVSIAGGLGRVGGGQCLGIEGDHLLGELKA